jgi:hypothetical protein
MLSQLRSGDVAIRASGTALLAHRLFFSAIWAYAQN